MSRHSNLRIAAGAFFAFLALTQEVPAQMYSSVEDLWSRYNQVVANRDEVEVLSCYEES